LSSWSTGLDIAYRALQAQQQAIDVVNHNIANANTPGYSRQVADLGATPPSAVIGLSGRAGQMGTGVAVIDLRRSRSSFIDYQVRSESHLLGQWEVLRDGLKQVEVMFNEPSDAGLNSLMSTFWQAWQDLTNAPQDAGARRALVEQSDSLAMAFNSKYSQLTSIQQDLDRQIRVGSDKVNQLAEQVASLNVKIAQAERVGQRANDLRDQRDLVMDELSHLIRVTYYETSDGVLNVFMGSRALVFKERAQSLTTNISSGFASVVWADDGSAASISNGDLYGLQQARDVHVPSFINDLNSIASQIITRVNTLHTAGYGLDNSTGLNFFDGSDARDMAINPLLKTTPEQVAAAGSINSPGDNSVAVSISGLQRALTMSGGTADFGRFFASTMSRLGVDSQRSDMMATNQKLLVDHLTRQRDSVSGVSLDEETIHLIEYQRAYQAAARVVNVVDEMLDRLINGMGLVGR